MYKITKFPQLPALGPEPGIPIRVVEWLVVLHLRKLVVFSPRFQQSYGVGY